MAEKILALLRAPGGPPGSGSPQESLAKGTELIELADKFLARYPKGEKRDLVLQAKMEAMFQVAAIQGQSLDALHQLSKEVLAGKPAPELASHAAFWQIRCEVAKKQQELVANDELKDAQKDAEFTSFVLERLSKYVRDYPASDFAPGMYARLIESAEEEGKLGDAESYLEQLRKHHPTHVLTEMAEAKVRRLRGVGKPFELSFTSTDGRKVDVQKLRGKVVLVDFWASWCMPCRAGMPHLKELYRKHGPKKLEILGISLDQSREQMDAYLKDASVPWPIFFDSVASNDFARKWAVEQIPTYFLVDKKGLLRSTNAHGKLDEMIPKLLAE
jgi:thiol-disulfide isomerase/thioredoxin